MLLFLDTSALIKLYVEERGSETMRILITRPDLQDGFFASDLVAIEVEGVLAKKLRKGELSGASYRIALNDFGRDYSVAINRVALSEAILAAALLMSGMFSRRSLSPLDIVHVSTAQELSYRAKMTGAAHSVLLVASDRPLAGAAESLGIATFDPERGDPGTIPPLELADG
jgi:uncharacterized protein